MSHLETFSIPNPLNFNILEVFFKGIKFAVSIYSFLKNYKMGVQMKKLLHFLPFLLVIIILSKGCNYDNPIVTTIQNPAPSEMIYGPIDSGLYTIHMGQVFQTLLITSNNVRIGVLKVWYDTVKFYFKFVSDNAYCLKNIHLSAVRDRSKIPLSGNCPNIEIFNYQIHNLPTNTMTYSFTVPYIYLRPPRTFYISSQVEYENKSIQDPNCLVAWAKGVNFWNCTQFSKYFGLEYAVGN
jgi:hypothetical protein